MRINHKGDSKDYFCTVCGRWFNADESEPHTLPDGEDCHAECCSICNGRKKFKKQKEICHDD